MQSQNFSKKKVINNKHVTNIDLIDENFNKHFFKIDPKLAKCL